MTMGLKPNAHVLNAGMVEPNCNSNFIEAASADKQKRYFAIGGKEKKFRSDWR